MRKVYNILLIDDKENNISLINTVLSNLDIQVKVDVIHKEDQLIDRLENNPPDLVISNYHMPTQTGINALQIVQDRQPQLPFIMVAGSIGEEKAINVMLQGASDYAMKQNLDRLGPAVLREHANYKEHIKKSSQLEKNHSQYEKLLQSVNGIVWEADAETLEFLYVSPQSKQLLGYTPEEWLGEPNFWKEHIHPDDRKEAILFCHYKVQQGENHEFEYRMIDTRNEVVWMRDYVTVVTENGESNRLCGFMVDISREKKAERQRDKAYDFADIGHWELDLKNEELYWSNAIKKLHEVDPDYEPDVETAIEFYKKGENREKITRVLENAIETGQPFEIELKILTAKGNEKWVRVLGETDFRNGKCVHIFGSTQDISTRKVFEKKYRDIFNLSPQPMWVYDPETLKFLDVNRAAINHYGFSREEFMNMTLKDIRPDNDIPDLLKAVKEENSSKEDSYYEGLFRHKAKDESIIFVNIKRTNIDYEGRKAAMVLAEDVTEKMGIERELQLSEQRFKSLVQDGSDLIAILDQNGIYTYVSPTSESVLGISPEEFIGNNALDYIHEKHKVRIQRVLATLPDKKSTTIKPFLLKDGKGGWRWVETIMTNLLDNPAIQGFLANSRDVTSQIEREQKLRENLELYENVTKATDDVIYDWDLTEDILHWDDSFHDKFIYNIEKGTYSIDDWAQNVHTEDRAEAQQSLNDLLRSSDLKWEQEYRFKKKDNTYATVFERGFIIRDQYGEAIRMIGSLQDITERKKYEEELEQLSLVASKTTDLIIMTDPEENITWVNQSFVELTGYSFEESMGQNPGELLQGPDTDSETVNRLAKAIQNRDSVQGIILNYSKTGRPYWLDLTIDPIFDEEGNCEGFIAIERDVTEQVKRQKELRESLERYETVSKATSDTIWELDLETDTIDYSQNIYNVFGYERQQVDEVEDWWRSKIHPDDRPEVLAAIEKALLSSKERFQMEYRFQVSDGSYKYIYDRAFIVEDQVGNPIRIIGAMRDVSDQKKAQCKMTEAFQERERILDRINEAFFATDQNWNVTYWNKQAEEVVGVARDDILGENLWETFPVAKEHKFFREYKRALREQVSVQFEEYYPPLEQWLEVTAYPSEEGLSVFFRDITKRREAEQSLQKLYQRNRLVLESTDEGIYGIDNQGYCTFINKAAAKMLGYHTEECIGKNMHELIHHQKPNGEPYPESECPIFISKNNYESCRVTEEVFWRADGTCFNVEYTSNPMIDDGEIMGGVVVFSDITVRKRQEIELQDSLEEKETLLMEIHHRVKNNLAVVSGLMQLQAFEENDEYVKHRLNDATNRIKTMGGIHELLYQSDSFTRIDADNNIRKLVTDIVETFKSIVELDIDFDLQKISLNINQAIPFSLMVNEVITNVMKHAFVDRNKGVLTVKLTEKDGVTNIRIMDNGRGLPNNFKAISTNHTLGIQLIDSLSAQLNGEYTYEAMKEGTLFTFTFTKADVKGTGNALLS